MSHRIKTEIHHPVRGPSFWYAWCDELGADDSPYGTGGTEAEAIADLREQLEDLGMTIETFTMIAALAFCAFAIGSSVGARMADIDAAMSVPLDVRGER